MSPWLDRLGPADGDGDRSRPADAAEPTADPGLVDTGLVDEGGRVATEAELDALERRITAWLERQRAENPILEAVDRGEAGQRRWYVRLRGEEKDVTTIWLTLRQRSLHVETYVVPAPDENHRAFYELFLRRNAQLYGLAFAIGDEDAVYLVGHVPLSYLDGAVLDRIVGSVYAYVEQTFRTALRVGFASRLGRRQS